MKITERLPYEAHFATLTFLLGILTADQWSLLTYYSEADTSDQFIFAAIAFSFFFIGKHFLRLPKKTHYLLLAFFLFMALPGHALAYYLYRHSEWAVIIIYLGIATLGVITSHFSKELKTRISFLVFTTCFLAGFLLVLHIPSVKVIHGVLLVLLATLFDAAASKKVIGITGSVAGIVLALIWSISDPVPVQYFESQQKYYDPVIDSWETPFQTVDVTRWKGQDWFYYNRVNQFSSIDHWLYFEPMAHPLAHLATKKEKILIIGGENGMITKELLAYPQVESIVHLPLDTILYKIARENPHFTRLNENALQNKKVVPVTVPAFHFLHEHPGAFDLIFIDVPDPVDLELNQYYSHEFYALCHTALTVDGAMITQAGSPYYASKAFYCIQRTMERPGFSTVALHNQVLTLGEWGWIIGSKKETGESLKASLQAIDFSSPPTKWLNKEAMKMMLSFGKQLVEVDTSINSLKDPVVHRYYTKGTWQF